MTPDLHRLIIVVATVFAIAIGVHNLVRPLANPDEGRYSEISREMAATGDWVTPRLNGIKYFEKPPLQYWATAISLKLFGVNEAAARLYVALSALATIGLVAYTAWRLARPLQATASVVALVSSPYFMAMGGAITLDMGLTLWTTATFCTFVLAEDAQDARTRRRWMLAAWVAIALAVLSKGLVGIVFPAAMLGLYCLVHRDFRVLARLEWMRGLLLLLVITAPWFALVSYRNPEFAEFFFIHEHFARFLTHVHRRTEPFWYFLPILLIGFLPWMFALPGAIVHAWRLPDEKLRRPMRLAILWSLFIVVFFSASGSKLPSYILPAFPPLAIVVGRYLLDARHRVLGIVVGLSGVFTLVAAAVLWSELVTSGDAWTVAVYTDARPWFTGALAIMAVSQFAGAVMLLQARRLAGIATVMLGVVLMLGGAEVGYRVLLPRQSGYEVARLIESIATPKTRLYQVKMYDQTIPFYLQRTTKIVDYGDEFELGFAAEPGSHIERWWDLFPEWERPGDAIAIMQPEIYERFRARGLPMQLLHEDSRRIVVRKP